MKLYCFGLEDLIKMTTSAMFRSAQPCTIISGCHGGFLCMDCVPASTMQCERRNTMVAHLGHITAIYIFFVIPSERKCDFVFPSKN